MSETNGQAAEVITTLDPVARQAVEWALEGYTGPRPADTLEAVAEVVRQWRVSQDLARQAREENEKVFRRYAYLKADMDRMMNERAKPPTTPSDKLAEAEKRIEALETRLAEMEGRFVARLDRLSEWQSRDAKAGADAIEALAGSLKALTARVGDLERHDIANSRIGRLNGEQITALVERVKALEGRAKAETKGRLYRARNEGGAAAAGLPEASRFFESTPYLRWADSNRLALEGAGVRGCWLEVSDDNGQTWKRCEENDNAE